MIEIYIYYIIIGIIISILIYSVINLLRKNEKYEDIINEQNKLILNQNETINSVFENLTKSREFINTVDEKGIFQSDDEVGLFFSYLKDIQSSLENYFNSLKNAKDQKN